MESLGTVQKAKKVPKDVLKKSLWGWLQKAESDPQRSYGRSVVETPSQRVYNEDINRGETSDTCGRTDRAVWGATAIKVVHLYSLLGMEIMLTP